MLGGKESFNVAVAAAIAFYHLRFGELVLPPRQNAYVSLQ